MKLPQYRDQLLNEAQLYRDFLPHCGPMERAKLCNEIDRLTETAENLYDVPYFMHLTATDTETVQFYSSMNLKPAK